MSTQLQKMEQGSSVPSIANADVLDVESVVKQVALVKQVMERVMTKDVHYGVCPGTDKPTLKKPGAEILCCTFRLGPDYEVFEKYDGQHYTVRAKCTLNHIPTGNRVGSGDGLCTTKESKYAFRISGRKCPKCGAEAIIQGKPEYGGGWICWSRKGGCGEKFGEEVEAIKNQQPSKVENESLPDQYNTVLKMACKRALIAVTLNATAASDIFTQDLDDEEPKENTSHSTPSTSDNRKGHASRSGLPDLISDGQRKRLYAIMKQAGWIDDHFRNKLAKEWGYNDTRHILWKDYEEICKMAEAGPGKKSVDEDIPF